MNLYNRINLIDLWKKGNSHFVKGILESIDKEYIKLILLEDGNYFGELIGPKVQANPYELKNNLWLPFEKIQERFTYKFWDDYIKDLNGLNDQDIYEKVSGLFKNLWSICKRKYGIKGPDVNENTSFIDMAAEGIVFYNRDRTMMAKLRRDMFDWFKGKRHGI